MHVNPRAHSLDRIKKLYKLIQMYENNHNARVYFGTSN